MSFPPYPDYKDSGVEWLGEVPGHWKAVPMKYLVRFQSGGTPSKEERAYWEGDVPWASAKDMKAEFLADTEDHITQHAVNCGAATLVEAGAVLVVVRGMILARFFPVSVSVLPMAINQDLKAVIPGPSLLARYFSWYLRGTSSVSLSRLDEAGHGTKALRMDAWASLEVSLPPLSEQSAIAAFLDHETAKIDALVVEQEKLIELLKEKRQAVISHAVTKGLDPSVPMKDSGIKWLGEVPAHWEMTPLSAVTKAIQTGPFGSQLHAEDYVEDHVPVVNPANLQEEGISPNWSNTVLPDVRDRLSEYVLKYGDIILGRRGEMGRCAVVEEREIGWLCGTGSLIIRLSEQVLSRFLATYIRTLFVREWLALQSVGSTMDNLNAGILSRLKVPVPPKEEQALILSQLDEQMGKLDGLTAEAQRAIELLKEHRSALISAAVTGKIDVRGLISPQEAA